MNCELIEELFAAYLDNEVTPEEKSRVEKHLAACEKCREELKGLGATQKSLRQVLKSTAEEIEPSPRAWDAVRERIESRVSFWEGLSRFLNSTGLRMAVPLAVLVILAAGLIWHAGVFTAPATVPAQTPGKFDQQSPVPGPNGPAGASGPTPPSTTTMPSTATPPMTTPTTPAPGVPAPVVTPPSVPATPPVNTPLPPLGALPPIGPVPTTPPPAATPPPTTTPPPNITTSPPPMTNNVPTAPPVVNVAPGQVTVQPPNVTVNPPQVTVATPPPAQVTIQPPPVTVAAPPPPAPVVVNAAPSTPIIPGYMFLFLLLPIGLGITLIAAVLWPKRKH